MWKSFLAVMTATAVVAACTQGDRGGAVDGVPTPNLTGSPAATGTPETPTPPTPTPTPTPDEIFVGAGDIADCNAANADEITASLLDGIEGTVFTLGDNAYDTGTLAQYETCYGPTWGRHKDRTVPVPGNHEYATPGAAGYYAYFGDAAGDPAKGWYSFDLGNWHVVVLNSNCDAVGGCGAGSEQELWLRADLEANEKPCTIALWHHARFSSSQHGNDSLSDAFWKALYDHHAEIVLSAHDHTYERFAPQAPDATPDPEHGIREFVVGSGGRSHYGFPTVRANSEVREGQTYGVLKLTLKDFRYEWEFVGEAGSTFTDAGSTDCH